VPAVGFETTISAGGRQKTYALDRAATGTGTRVLTQIKYNFTGICRTVQLVVQNSTVTPEQSYENCFIPRFGDEK
jgi:hypothetical protein